MMDRGKGILNTGKYILATKESLLSSEQLNRINTLKCERLFGGIFN